MQEIFANLIIGIVGSIIAAIIFEALRAGTGWFPEPKSSQKRASEPDAIDDQRAANRRRFSRAVSNFTFYTLTFLLIYEAVSLPLMIKVLFSKEVVLLSSAKFIGSILPDVAITADAVQVKLLIWVIPLYVFSLLTVNFVAGFVAKIVNFFWVITINVWQRIQLLLFLLIAACLAIFSIWIFYPFSLQDALYNFLGVIAIAIIFLGATKR